MVYSDTTNKLGIVQTAETLCDVDFGDVSGNTNNLIRFTGFANQENREILTEIMKVYNGWQYDDGNNTDMPLAKADLVSGTKRYSLPSDALTVKKIDAYKSDGSSVELKQILLEDLDVSLDEFETIDGVPKYYRLIGNVIELYPTPNYTTTSNTGLALFFDREPVSFATSDTTKTPGFASIFHYLIPLGMAIKWLKIKQPASLSLANYKVEKEQLMEQLKDYYSSKNMDGLPINMKAKTYSFE